MPARLLLFALVVGCGNNIAIEDGPPRDTSETDRGRRELQITVLCGGAGCDAWASARRWREGIRGTHEEVLAAEGDCELIQTHFVDGGWEAIPLDAGELTLTQGSGSTALTSDVTRVDLDGGEEITVEGTGGADFPTFTTKLNAPADVTLSPVFPVARGEPLYATWPGLLQGNVRLTVENGSHDIVCDTSDDGEHSIAGSLTAWLRDGVTLELEREASSVVDLGDEATVTTSIAQRADQWVFLEDTW